MPINEYYIRNYIKISTNQDGLETTFASNFLKDLTNRYMDCIKRNNGLIEKIEDKFLNVYFIECAKEMGVSEDLSAKALFNSNNDIKKTILILGLDKNEFIDYYLEELTKEVFFYFFPMAYKRSI